MPPMSSTSNLPFSNSRTSSGVSNRFRITSSIAFPPVPSPPYRLNRLIEAQGIVGVNRGGPIGGDERRAEGRHGEQQGRLDDRRGIGGCHVEQLRLYQPPERRN